MRSKRETCHPMHEMRRFPSATPARRYVSLAVKKDSDVAIATRFANVESLRIVAFAIAFVALQPLHLLIEIARVAAMRQRIRL
ncbi:hypothetical protein [Paraburkholderia caballeronis]|uniref:hypothetical protein n=1 Tax=Paraburkholderia caballeronis TaxID=416943 RepID=UPI00115F7E18|nr:hypothetical protein [Paraburkholderia caballeronis]